MSPRPLIGIDIGGTKTEAVALDRDSRIEATVRLATVPGPEAVLGTAERAVRELRERTGRDDYAAIGIGLPGQLDRASGEIRNAYNMGIERLAIGPLLAERTGIDTQIDNDVTAATIGAVHLMGLPGDVAYLNLGTGLASGAVVAGAPVRGAHGVSGEIGHLPISRLDRSCPCGQTGCLETQTSGAALKRFWPVGGDDPGPGLLAAIARGDAVARREFEYLVEGAASAVRLLALTFDPDSVVIGGGLRLLGGPLIGGIRGHLRRWADESPFIGGLGFDERVKVLPEGSPAAAVGAALSALH